MATAQGRTGTPTPGAYRTATTVDGGPGEAYVEEDHGDARIGPHGGDGPGAGGHRDELDRPPSVAHAPQAQAGDGQDVGLVVGHEDPDRFDGHWTTLP